MTSSRWYGAVPVLICVLLIALSVAHSFASPFWGDEIYSHYPIADPSLAHLLSVSRRPMNTAPPLYFVLGWFYAHLFGAGELSLRLLSCLFLCGTVGVMWAVLRRAGYRAGAVAYALAAAFTLCPEIVTQSIEARFYAPYLFFASVTVLCYQAVVDTPVQPWYRYAALYLASAALIFTDTIGLLYSGCLVLTQLVLDFTQRHKQRPNFGVYLALAASWATFFVLWGAVTIAQQKAFAGATWVGRPNAGYIRLMFLPTKLSAPLLLLPLAAAAIIAVRNPRTSRVPDPIALAGVTFLLIPTALVCAASFVTASFFVTRYLFPLWIGWAIVLAAGLDYAARSDNQTVTRLLPYAVAVVLLVGAGSDIRGAKYDLHALLAHRNAPFSQESDAISAQITSRPELRGLPIIQTRVGYFLPTYYYDGAQSARDVFVTDPEFAAQAVGSGEMLASYVNLEAMARAYLPNNIFSLQPFLAAHDRFLLLDINDDWLRFRFADRTRFAVTPIARFSVPKPRSANETVEAQLTLIQQIGHPTP